MITGMRILRCVKLQEKGKLTKHSTTHMKFGRAPINTRMGKKSYNDMDMLKYD